MKTQTIRLIDVFVLGPGMIYYAMKWKGPPRAARLALALTGIATVIYNGKNYLREEEKKRSGAVGALPAWYIPGIGIPGVPFV